MGDRIGDVVEGSFAHAPVALFQRVLDSEGDRFARAALFADLCRLNALYMISRAGCGHVGTAFSCIDFVSWLLLEELSPRDLFFSSKGDDAPALYAALIGLGRLPEKNLDRLSRLGGLPGHPDIETHGIVANSGSLGMGVSKAKGMVLAHRLAGERRRVFVLTGDGELQEGQIWESLGGAVAHRMAELTVIVDHNEPQADTFDERTSGLGNLEAKFSSFGWTVGRAPGHDFPAIAAALEALRDAEGPKVLIVDTIKGRGVAFMEHAELPTSEPLSLYRYHFGAPDAYRRASEELITRIERALDVQSLGRASWVRAPSLRPPLPTGARQDLVAAYGRALVNKAHGNPRIVALDTDQMVDMGLHRFREDFPSRFVECGIAETDMVSMAGGLALRGLLPVCHSFSSFLTPRANEQMYSNATERTRIVYVGGRAGLVPAGGGHSHQAVRDIALMGAVPNLEVIAPASESAVAAALDYAIEHAPGSCYLRLCSLPWALPFEPDEAPLEPGRGRVIREGADATLIAYGPVMLSQAYLTAEHLAESAGLEAQVIDLPWLNRVDGGWLVRALGDRQLLVTLDDHYLEGGQGQAIAAALLEQGRAPRWLRFGLRSIPACGRDDEVLQYHGLDAEGLAAEILRRRQR